MLTPSWQAVLDDGTLLEEGKQIHYVELFSGKYLGRLREFRLVDRSFKHCKKCGVPVLPPRVLIRVRLDKNKRLIYRKRPPLPGMGMGSGRKPAVVWLVGWQQTLRNFTDVRGNPANVQCVAVLNEATGAIYFLDRYVEDVGTGTHEPELYAAELAGGVKGHLDHEGALRPDAGALELEDERQGSDVAGIETAPPKDPPEV